MSQTPVSSRSWRKRGATETTKGARATQITLLFLLIGILVGVFLYVFWPRNRTKPFVHVFYVQDYSQSDVPAPLYINNDIKDIRGHFDVDKKTGDGGLHSFGTSKVSSSQSFKKLDAELKNQFEQIVDRDVAIIYVAAHGVSYDGNGYLLSSNSTSRDTKSWCPIEDMLNIASKIDAKTKVIFLDAGRIETDIYSGGGVNEFPYLLDKAVEEIDDESVWVICSHSLMQVSNVSHARKRSVFGWAVGQAFQDLSGKDEDSGDSVSLAAFYTRVLDHCATYAKIGKSSVQTPLLMRGGTGFIDEQQWETTEQIASDTVLFYRDQINRKVNKKKKKKDEQASNSLRIPFRYGSGYSSYAPMANLFVPLDGNRTGALTANENNAKSFHQDDDDSKDDKQADAKEPDAADQQSGSGENENNAPQNTPREFNVDDEAAKHPDYETLSDAHKQMMRIWLLRDWLESRPVELKMVSPVDFAPDLWHQLNLELIAHDQKIRARGKVSDDGLAQRKLNDIEVGLKELVASLKEGRNGDPNLTTLLNKVIIEAYNQNRGAIEFDISTFKESDQQLAQRIHKWLCVYRDVSYRARYYAQWFPGRTLDQKDASVDIKRLFDELVEHRELFENSSYIEIGSAKISKLQDAAADLLSAESRVIRWLQDSFEVAGRESTGQFEAEYWIARLHESPLIGYQPLTDSGGNPVGATKIDRFALYKQTLADAEAKSVFYSERQAWPTLVPASTSESVVKSKLALLAEVFKLDTKAAFRQVSQSLSELNRDADLQQKLLAYRNVGKIWKAETDRIFDRVDPNSTQREAEFQRWRFMSLLDARQVRGLGSIGKFAAPATQIRRAKTNDRIRVTAGSVEPVSLDETTTKLIQFAVESDLSTLQIASINFDERLLSVSMQNGQESTPIKTGSPFPVDIIDNSAELKLAIQARDGVFRERRANGGVEQTQIQVVAKLGDVVEPFGFDVVLPFRDWVDLEVQQLNWRGASNRLVESDYNKNVLTLKCLPNTQSHFEFFLRNKSGRSKNIVAEYWVVQLPPEMQRDRSMRPRVGTAKGRQGGLSRNIVDHMRRVLSEPEDNSSFMLASTGETIISPNGREKISFKKPEPPASDQGNGTVNTSLGMQDPAFIDSDYGVAVRLLEKREGEDKLTPRPDIFWIEYQRVSVSQMLESANATYKDDQLTIELLISDDLILDRGMKEVACSVSVNDPDISVLNETVTLSAEQKLGTLAVKLPARDTLGKRTRYVDVSVLGQPRAYVFEVDLQSKSVDDVRPGLTRITIGEVVALDEDDQAIEKEDAPTTIDGHWAVKKANKIVANIHVDLPLIRRDGDSATCALTVPNLNQANAPTEPFSADRFMAYQASIENDEFLIVKSTVEDHTATFLTSGKFRAQLNAQAKSTNAQGKIASDADTKSLVFDNLPPTEIHIRFNDEPAKTVVPLGGFVVVEVKVDDTDNGIGVATDSVKIGLDEDGSGDVTPNEFKIATRKQGEQGVFYRRIRIPEKLEVGPEYEVMAIAADKLGNTNDRIGPIKLSVTKPAKVADNNKGNGGGDDEGEKKVDPPKTFSIKLDVKFGSNRLSGDAKAKVSIKGPKNLSANANSSKSSVSFDDLPAGEYKVTATGKANNGYDIESEEVTIQVGPDNKNFDPIVLTRKR